MSWKKYGGTNKLDKLNNISVNTIVTDKFTLKQFYVGDWDICGGLSVKDNAFINGNVEIRYEVSIGGSLTVDGSLNVSDTNIYGDIFIANSAFIKENIYLDPNASTLFSGSNSKFGLNKSNPQATLDISSNLEKTLDIHSSAANNKNVVARNATDKGITVNVEPTKAYIDFYVDGTISSGIPSGRLLYEAGGNFTIDVSNIVKFKPRVAFTQDLTKGFIADERIVIYDNSIADVPYLPLIYNKPDLKSGTALNLVAGDNSSNVFFRMGTEAGKGLTLGGGQGPNGESMGIIALTDTSSNKYPALNIFSGTVNKNLATSVAVNKHNVAVDASGGNKYALDVNGPLHVEHQETLYVDDVSFSIYAQANVGQIVYAVGASTDVSNQQYFSKSVDGGYTWTTKRIVDASTGLPFIGSLESGSLIFKTIYAYNASEIIIGSQDKRIYRSINGGNGWTAINYVNGNNNNDNTDGQTPTSGEPNIDADIGGLYISAGRRMIIGFDISSTGNAGKIINSRTWDNQGIVPSYVSTDLSGINGIHGYGDDVVVVGVYGVVPYRGWNNGYTTFGTRVATTDIFYGVHTYYDGNYIHAVAVGEGIIYYTHNLKWNNGYNAVTWNNVALPGVTLKKVRVLDASNAIAVGNNGAVYYSNDGYNTWSRAAINNARLNTTNLTSISIISANDFVISGASGEIFNLWNPYLLNRANNNVVEASGNMVISGDLQINDRGQLLTNNQTFNLLPTNASTINIGSGGGNTNVQTNLNVSGNAVFSGWITQW